MQSGEGAFSATVVHFGSRSRRVDALFVALSLAGGVALVAAKWNQGWFPHDDGSFGQMAVRVLEGQLPHREFADLYTGGMTFLNAAMFWVFGQNLIWLRVPLFVLFVAFLPAYYGIVRRFVPPAIACLTTLAAVTWSLPNYTAAVPSWYILFFSTFGVYCAFRYFESGRLQWLFAAGLLGGVAISFKITGIWYVIAVIFTLLVAATSARRERAPASAMSLVIPGAAAVVTLIFVAGVFGPSIHRQEAANLLIPVAVLCCLPIALIARNGSAPFREQLMVMRRTVGIFVAGVAVPLAILVIPYVATHSMPDLLRGVLDSPRSRIVYEYMAMPQPEKLLYAVPVVVALAFRLLLSARLRWAFDVTVIAAMVWLLATAEGDPHRQILWTTARSTAPFVIVVGVIALTIWRGQRSDDPKTLGVILLLFVAGFASLSQFPFAPPIYFSYVAPVILLAAVAVTQRVGAGRGLLPVALLAGLAVFGYVYLDGATRGNLDGSHDTFWILDDKRASIRIPFPERTTYQRITSLVRSHAKGQYTFAGPDAPQVYYLSGFRNPTRSLFDFLDTTDSARGAALLNTLGNRHVNVIAINNHPEFSDPLEASVVRRLDLLYPSHEMVDRFDVRWRN